MELHSGRVSDKPDPVCAAGATHMRDPHTRRREETPLPNGRGSGAQAPLASVLGHVGAEIIESACVQSGRSERPLLAKGSSPPPRGACAHRRTETLLRSRMREMTGSPEQLRRAVG